MAPHTLALRGKIFDEQEANNPESVAPFPRSGHQNGSCISLILKLSLLKFRISFLI